MTVQSALGAGAVMLMMTATACTHRAPPVGTPAPPAPAANASVVQANLSAPGSPPFHLKALITERGDPSSKTKVEIFWMGPDQWRRTIQSETEFSQTLIMNGGKVFEHDSDDYFPVWLQTLVTAMVDPSTVVDAVRPGDLVITKANGGADESGKLCFPGRSASSNKMCIVGRYGLQESVGAVGRSVTFTNYQDFHGKRVARILTYKIDAGDSYTAQVTELNEVKQPDRNLFAIPQPTAPGRQIRSVVLPEADFRKLAAQPLEIIWPQVLDGKTSGETSYYISVDRAGQVREVLPVSVAVERADDSARRQIMKWKFAPAMKNGVAVQVEALLNFTFNTRAYGPPNPLTDAEVRKLASNIVEPNFPPGTASGTTYGLSIAVDEAGNVIEVIAGEGPPALFQPCYQALKKWHFSPILEDGKPRPYRAQVTFQVP